MGRMPRKTITRERWSILSHHSKHPHSRFCGVLIIETCDRSVPMIIVTIGIAHLSSTPQKENPVLWMTSANRDYNFLEAQWDISEVSPIIKALEYRVSHQVFWSLLLLDLLLARSRIHGRRARVRSILCWSASQRSGSPGSCRFPATETSSSDRSRKKWHQQSNFKTWRSCPYCRSVSAIIRRCRLDGRNERYMKQLR